MFISTNGITYYVEVVGEGRPVVFLHGFTGNSASWHQPTKMIKNEFQCVFIDLIGHGKTDSPADTSRYQIEKVAKDIIHILNVLNISQTHLVGYSMGGRVALATSILYPSRISSLILESSSPGLRTDEERRNRRHSDELLARRIEQDGIEAFINYWESIPLFASQKKLPIEKQLLVRKQRLGNNPVGLANSLRGMGTGVQPSYWERLCELNFPLLLLCGELDQKFCRIAIEMCTNLPNAKMEKIINAGHAIHVEQPQFFGKIINEFVSDHNTQ